MGKCDGSRGNQEQPRFRRCGLTTNRRLQHTRQQPSRCNPKLSARKPPHLQRRRGASPSPPPPTHHRLRRRGRGAAVPCVLRVLLDTFTHAHTHTYTHIHTHTHALIEHSISGRGLMQELQPERGSFFSSFLWVVASLGIHAATLAPKGPLSCAGVVFEPLLVLFSPQGTCHQVSCAPHTFFL
jgi:hypothetical protein